ncbi:MAG: BrnT family toxin [Dehalococcoidia bacterium]
MRFVWDEAKGRANLRKHHIDFADLEPFFISDPVAGEDDSDPAEDRQKAIGWTEDVLLVVVFTETADVIRIISARKATRHEEIGYWHAHGYRLGPPADHD